MCTPLNQSLKTAILVEWNGQPFNFHGSVHLMQWRQGKTRKTFQSLSLDWFGQTESCSVPGLCSLEKYERSQQRSLWASASVQDSVQYVIYFVFDRLSSIIRIANYIPTAKTVWAIQGLLKQLWAAACLCISVWVICFYAPSQRPQTATPGRCKTEIWEKLWGSWKKPRRAFYTIIFEQACDLHGNRLA